MNRAPYHNKVKYCLKTSLFYRFLLIVLSGSKRRSFKTYYAGHSRLICKSVLSWILFGLEAKDFYRLRCEEKPWREIRTFVSHFSFVCFYGYVNSRNASRLLKDKYNSFTLFPDLYGRDIEMISKDEIDSGEAKKKIQGFIDRGHSCFIVKPLNANRGRGIEICYNADDACGLLIASGGGIIEELIIQHKELAEFNASSVNTLRMNTVNYGNGNIECLWPCLRMGRAGSIVDNAGAGGVFGAVDVNTGEIIGVADEKQHSYVEHPDSHRQLIGYVVPYWKEACAIAKQAASRISGAAFVGWDLALSEKGWVLVEGNHGPLIIWQIASGKGVRDKFLQIEKALVFSEKK